MTGTQWVDVDVEDWYRVDDEPPDPRPSDDVVISSLSNGYVLGPRDEGMRLSMWSTVAVDLEDHA
jgi:hypothetical protein